MTNNWNLRSQIDAEKIHEWYLETCKELPIESYNPKAQTPYSSLAEDQKKLDQGMVNKLFQQLEIFKEKIITDIEQIQRYGDQVHITIDVIKEIINRRVGEKQC